MESRSGQKRPSVLLFDLGGVIVGWVGMDEISNLTGWPRSKVVDIYSQNPIFQNYENGTCKDDVFIAELLRVFGLNYSPSDMARLWCEWVRPSFDGVLEALDVLRQDYVVACLSNTNALHWQYLKTHLNTNTAFDYAFASHHIHAVKPARESYLIPLEVMSISPSDVWFFDDTKANIDAARNLGMTAYHIDRNQGVLPTLKSLALV